MIKYRHIRKRLFVSLTKTGCSLRGERCKMKIRITEEQLLPCCIDRLFFKGYISHRNKRVSRFVCFVGYKQQLIILQFPIYVNTSRFNSLLKKSFFCHCERSAAISPLIKSMGFSTACQWLTPLMVLRDELLVH